MVILKMRERSVRAITPSIWPHRGGPRPGMSTHGRSIATHIYHSKKKGEDRRTPLWIHEHTPRIQKHILRIEEHFAAYMLYSRQACRLTKYKVAEFIKLIKRFRFLQVWLKSSDIWRWLSDLKWELFEAFSKVEILMFFDKRTLNASLKNNNLSFNLNFWNNHLNYNLHTFLSQIIVSEFFFFIFWYQECFFEHDLRLTWS
jgi:hypothetical protein